MRPGLHSLHGGGRRKAGCWRWRWRWGVPRAGGLAARIQPPRPQHHHEPYDAHQLPSGPAARRSPRDTTAARPTADSSRAERCAGRTPAAFGGVRPDAAGWLSHVSSLAASPRASRTKNHRPTMILLHNSFCAPAPLLLATINELALPRCSTCSPGEPPTEQ